MLTKLFLGVFLLLALGLSTLIPATLLQKPTLPTPAVVPTPTPFVVHALPAVALAGTPTPTPILNNQPIRQRNYTLDAIEGAIPHIGNCRTRTYTIAVVDPAFGLSREDVGTYVQAAATIWNSASNMPLLSERNEGGDLTIQFLADERQPVMAALTTLETTLSQEKDRIIAQKQRFETLNVTYEQNLAAYQREPTETYQRSLTDITETILPLVDSINGQVTEFNRMVATYNTENEKLAALLSKKPYAGVFTTPANTITISLVHSPTELVHTLAHEFGHALGFSHTSDSRSLMYPETTETLSLSSQDRSALSTLCR